MMIELKECEQQSREPFWTKNAKPVAKQVTFKKMTNIEVLTRIGGGHFGEVYKGLWQGTPVALKTIKLEDQGEDFQREAELLSQLSHPNIVQVKDTIFELNL